MDAVAGTPPLGQSYGYGIVLGLGFAFAFGESQSPTLGARLNRVEADLVNRNDLDNMDS